MHRFRRSAFLAGLTSGTDVNGYNFGSVVCNGIANINGIAMPNSGEFTGLFDQYKVLRFSFELIPRFDSKDISTPGVGLPTIYWIYDMDDNTTPSSISELMERPNVRKAILNKPVKITVKFPCVSTMVYRNPTTTGYVARRSPWIDINDNMVPLYGIKYAIVGSASTNYQFDQRVSWEFMCKNPR